MARSTPPPDLTGETRARPRILLIEDDAPIAYMLTDVLESAGYLVREAATLKRWLS